MYHKKYKTPDEIQIHFLGETTLEPQVCSRIKTGLQFLGYLIFKTIDRQKQIPGRFTVTATQKHGRAIVRLSEYEQDIFMMFEDNSGEWVVRLNGSKQDLADFIKEFLISL